ncbi:MAG TPA: hypothetical protein VGR35_08300 [Tepidisphaeraceae bacterium]|nr:hypothetical protein [Tepidisphaeraceae bacterium]
MNEQRPPTSPAAHPAGQPQRAMPAQPVPHGPQMNRGGPGLQQPARPAMRPPPPTDSLPLDDEDDGLVVLDDALPLDDDAQVTAPKAAAAPAPTPKKITFGAENTVRKHEWKRKPHLGGQGACRVRTFHGKCSDQGLEYLDDAINVFLDEHPDIEVKFVQSNVAMFDGKFKDFALIVNVWY